MTIEAVLDTVALVLVLIGAVLCLTATIGLLRWRDVPTRLHAATKPQVLGVLLIVIAVELSLRSWAALAFGIPIVLIQFATAPLAAHMVGRAAYRNRTTDEENLFVDELRHSTEQPGSTGSETRPES
ncbi:monovalent cation/H(+) antiporter subunit G [Microbacterium enclense]|uniref:Multicomponent Na+:H+ antiporter subunit G n=1 Tax=Microbacterium enclense TaxID=993073 RepID=A0A1G6R459_9MICO|nr:MULTISPECIES: monovalent cation/H(+) antiporter subunit G [Microbacterium]KSU51725.1 cation:proton antiporter [Microbacterium enclense]MCM3615446.1 monovalent cation/H(+) antiporter subunit G [Microbacterium enclense]SDC99094.1 multicomponent Na+:H+ antiporter subunit G [Microbacterium enclense]